MQFEERDPIATLGTAYMEYRKRVPMLFRWQNDGPSWRRVTFRQISLLPRARFGERGVERRQGNVEFRCRRLVA